MKVRNQIPNPQSCKPIYTNPIFSAYGQKEEKNQRELKPTIKLRRAKFRYLEKKEDRGRKVTRSRSLSLLSLFHKFILDPKAHIFHVYLDILYRYTKERGRDLTVDSGDKNSGEEI